MTHQATPLLATQLRSATQALHAEVERAGIMPDLLRGKLPIHLYVALLRNLHAIYATLEPALTGLRHDPRIAPVCRTDMFRLPALESDLAALSSNQSWAELPVQAATQAYVARLLNAEKNDPVRLIAHAYVRYLGDVNGGQMLARTVSRLTKHLNTSSVAFYDFGSPAAAANHARDLREALDSLPLEEAEVATVVDEAMWAFKQHSLIFDALMSPSSSAAQVLSA
jgi:heme oxygenase